MQHTLPDLPYALDALEPYISQETLKYHHGKHHQAYVNNLNNLIVNTPFAQLSLEEIICQANGAIFNNAAQVWNHTFYWNCLTNKQTLMSNNLEAAIINTFSSVEKFKQQFSEAAIGLFGSGWTWLVKNKKNELSIIQTTNASCPLQQGLQPLLTCDVWEHAYYIDYRNARPKYVEQFWQLVNWEFVSNNLANS